MVKLVHIGDLHAGKRSGSLDRNGDLLYALEQIESFIRENGADYLIVAGDIFDKKTPDNASVELVSEFFVKISSLGTKIVAIAGNHDSASFLKSLLPWTQRYRIKLLPRFDREKFLYTEGEVAFALIPFISERAITSLLEGEEKAKLQYAQKMEKLLNFAAQRVKEFKYRVLVGHLFFANSKIGFSERELTVSDIYAVPQSAISDLFHYAALGHVHRHQRLEGAPTEAYYSGSLYQLDFGESGQEKFFNFVVLENNRTKVEKIKLSLKRRLEKIVITPSFSLSSLERLSKGNVYFSVEIEASDKREYLHLKEKVEKILGDRLLKINLKGFIAKGEKGPYKAARTLSLQDPLEVYKAYCQATNRKWDPQIEKYLKEALESLS